MLVLQDQEWLAREMGLPSHDHNRRRRARKGPEPACVQAPLVLGWHTQGEKDELTSCRLLRTETAQCTVRPAQGRKVCCGPPSSAVAVRDRGALKRCLREAGGPVKLVAVRPHTDGKVFVRPGVRLKSRTVRTSDEPEEHKRSK